MHRQHLRHDAAARFKTVRNARGKFVAAGASLNTRQYIIVAHRLNRNAGRSPDPTKQDLGNEKLTEDACKPS